MADLTFTVSMDANQAAQVMKNLKGQASDTAKAVEKSFNLAVLFGATKAGMRFLSQSMQEYAKESDSAKRSIDSITGAWAALKAEVGYGLASLIGADNVPTAQQVRQTAGVGRAAIMGLATDPGNTSAGLWGMFKGILRTGGGDPAAQWRDVARGAVGLSQSEGFVAGIEEMNRREKEILDGFRKAHTSNIKDQMALVGAGEYDQKKVEIEAQYRAEIERIVNLKKTEAMYDAEMAESDGQRALALRDARLEQERINEAVRQSSARFDAETDWAAAGKAMEEARRSFRDTMLQGEQDRALSIEQLKTGDTLAIAQAKARLQAERDIQAIKNEKAFADPAVQQPYIDKRNEQLQEELDALKGFYDRRESEKRVNYRSLSGLSAGLGQAGTLLQAFGSGPAVSAGGTSGGVEAKQLSALEKIVKNTDPRNAKAAAVWN